MNKRLAVVFDFDDTLAPDTTSALLEARGVDLGRFWGVENKALVDEGWDPVPAYLYQMVRFSRAQSPARPITRAELAAAGAATKPFAGVPTLFGRLRSFVASLDPEAQLEFFVISSGLGDLLRATPIARHFTDLFASDFAYEDDGAIAFPKRVVSFTDKTRYLFQIQKGFFGEAYRNRPFEVNRRVADEQLHIPLSHMVYVGDGFTDVPCFSLLKKHGGQAIGVYDKRHKDRRFASFRFVQEGRVQALHSADYSRDSDLVNALEMALGGVIQFWKAPRRG